MAKPTSGSFGASAAMHAANEHSAQQLQDKAAATKPEQVAAEVLSQEAAIDASIEQGQLPANVDSAVGPLPYKEFRSMHADVYEHIDSGNYLLMPKSIFTKKLGKLSIGLRPLTQLELTFLGAHSAGLDGPELAESLLRANLGRLALALDNLNGSKLAAMPSPETPEWWEHSAVVERLATLNGMDNSLVDTLLSLSHDIATAKFLAIREALLNPQ